MERQVQQKRPLIAVIGPCAAGKSLLVEALRARGYRAREVLQEHSYVPTMWQQLTKPDLLIYLDVSGEVALERRSAHLGARWWDKLAQRLRHARQHADLYIHTDDLMPEEVLTRVLTFLERWQGEA